MEARQCDVCGDFYLNDLDSRITRDVFLSIRIKGHRPGMCVFSRVNLIPMLDHGTHQKPLDLCMTCRKNMVREVGDRLLSGNIDRPEPKSKPLPENPSSRITPLVDAKGAPLGERY